jgi:hypothetical protein
MIVAESINNAISEGDIKSIRLMMKNSLLVDPSFAEFDEMSRLAENVRGLYDAHDGRDLSQDKYAWNDDYMNKLMVQVVDNFSHKRLDHLKEVVRYLRPVTVRQRRSTSTESKKSRQIPPNRPSSSERSSYQGKRRQHEHNHSSRIAAGSAVGAVAGGVIAGIAGGSVFIGAAAAAILAGFAVTVVTKGEKRDE